VTFILSLHIPKTAGSSLTSVYLKAFGSRLCEHNYAPEQTYAMTGAELRQRYDIVHGHLDLRKLRGVIDADTRLVTFLRDPVQRVVSSYHYHRRLSDDNETARMIREQAMTLEDFAAWPPEMDLQARMIAPVGPERVDFYGFSETYAASIAALARFLGIALEPDTPQNLNPEKALDARYQLPPAVDAHIRQQNLRDIELYRWAQARAAAGA
jgi:hypothetical protein